MENEGKWFLARVRVRLAPWTDRNQARRVLAEDLAARFSAEDFEIVRVDEYVATPISDEVSS